MYAKSGFAYIVGTMVQPLALAQHTLYADLLDQGGDELFDPDLPENGSLLVRGNRLGAPAVHTYYQGYRLAAPAGRRQRFARYLGRADDPEVAVRIAQFQRIKAVRAERVTTVRALIGAGMPRPDRTTGRIIEALARAGLFPDHAVLVGEAAYQTYGGVLGVRLPSRYRRTRDDPAVEIVVRDPGRLGGVLDALRAVDPSFATEPEESGSYRSAIGVQVAVASLDHAADGASDLIGFLIADPIRALVLHGPGIPVTIPAPERFAVHALIDQARRSTSSGRPIRAQDEFAPMGELIEGSGLAGRSQTQAEVFESASKFGSEWRAILP